MLQRALLILFSLSLVGCASLGGTPPPKPIVTLGVIDYSANQVIENNTNGQKFKAIHSIQAATYRTVVDAVEAGGIRVPLSQYDNAVAFRPSAWEIVQNYMDSLRAYIQNHCQPQ